MDKISYRIKSSSIATATATALLLSFPQFDDVHATTFVPADSCEFEPLGEASKPVSEALASGVYNRAEPQLVFALMTEVASRVIDESKPLDRDFATVVQKEFWNLLQ